MRRDPPWLRAAGWCVGGWILLALPGTVLLLALASLPAAVLMKTRRGSPTKRAAAWLLLGAALGGWLFGFGAYWSLRDRARFVEHPLPFPGDRLFRPASLMPLRSGVDRLGPQHGWARLDEPGWEGPVCVRVRPGVVAYLPREGWLPSGGVRELDWATATTPWWERAD